MKLHPGFRGGVFSWRIKRQILGSRSRNASPPHGGNPILVVPKNVATWRGGCAKRLGANYASSLTTCSRMSTAPAGIVVPCRGRCFWESPPERRPPQLKEAAPIVSRGSCGGQAEVRRFAGPVSLDQGGLTMAARKRRRRSSWPRSQVRNAANAVKRRVKRTIREWW